MSEIRTVKYLTCTVWCSVSQAWGRYDICFALCGA